MKKIIGEVLAITANGSLKLTDNDYYIRSSDIVYGKAIGKIGKDMIGKVVTLKIIENDSELMYKDCKEFVKKATPDKIEFKTAAIEENDFMELYKISCEIEKKGGLNYVRWGEAWLEMKKLDINANYEIHENENGMPYFSDKTGAFVKVSVTFKNHTHKVMLPVMDFRNQAVKEDGLTSVIINKSIQRCFTKAIAMFGIGLFVYLGENSPEDKE